MNSLQLSRTAKAKAAMRRAGMNGADIDALQTWLWLLSKNPRAGCRDLARCLKVAPSTAHARLKRLTGFGVLVKVFRTYVCTLQSLVNGTVKVVRQNKSRCPKSLILNRLSGFVRTLRTHTYSHKSEGISKAESVDQAANGAGLRGKACENYWLRQMGLPENC